MLANEPNRTSSNTKGGGSSGELWADGNLSDAVPLSMNHNSHKPAGSLEKNKASIFTYTSAAKTWGKTISESFGLHEPLLEVGSHVAAVVRGSFIVNASLFACPAAMPWREAAHFKTSAIVAVTSS